VLEVLDRLDGAGDGPAAAGAGAYEQLESELGDLWFQILFHAELATEAGQFTIADVARTIHDKLVRRHPHVFGEVQVDGAAELAANWEQLKQAEHGRASAVDGIPSALPALSLADKLIQRAERAGFPADAGDTGARLRELLPAGCDEEELGRHLLATVEVARSRGLDPEAALRRAALAASDRFRRSEQAADRQQVATWLLG